MEGWAGFTDSDLKKMKGSDPRNEGSPSKGTRPTSGGQRRNLQHKTPLSSKFAVQEVPDVAVDQGMMLSRPKPKPAANKNVVPVVPGDSKQTGTGTGNGKKSKDGNTGSHGHSTEGTTTQSPEGSTAEQNDQSDSKEHIEQGADDLIVDDQEIFKHEKLTMESFQKQQKMIEELNKKKRQILTQAIIERSKKAKAESVKLTELQKALAKLDQLLTVDVSIIRDKIENASRDFFEAQKRYDRAEKEFIESKIDLHKKMEAKESLTEHLYTVIYQNEMRKGKKLAELMTKLEMEDALEGSDIVECAMPHPSLISPVQLPAGRYGQIGPIRIESQPSSPTEKDPSDSTNKELVTDSAKDPTKKDLSDSTNKEMTTDSTQPSGEKSTGENSDNKEQIITSNDQGDSTSKDADTVEKNKGVSGEEKPVSDVGTQIISDINENQTNTPAETKT